MHGHRGHERFTQLYGRCYPPVLRYAHRRVGADDARDVVAMTFLTAWRRLGEVPEDDPLPWLYGVARRVIANETRGRRRAAHLTERLAGHEIGRHEPDVAGAAGVRLDLLGALATLTEPDQEVLRLVGWEQLTASQAAAVLGCSPAAVYVRVHRARRRLRRALDGNSDGDGTADGWPGTAVIEATGGGRS